MVSSMQGSLSNCTEEYVAEVWTLGKKAKPKKGISAAPLPVAHKDQSRARIFRRVDALNQMLSSEPENVNYLMSLGIALSQLGQSKRALEVMRKAVELRPDNVGMKSNVATLLNDMGQPEEALKFAEEVLASRPSMVEALNAKAIALARQFKLPEAIAVAEQTVKVRPRFVPFWANLVQLCIMAKRYDEALRHLDQFLRIAPGHPAERLRRQVIAARDSGGLGMPAPGMGAPNSSNAQP